MNKIENGIIEPSSVVSTYANYTKKIDFSSANIDNSKSHSYCQNIEC